MNDNRKVARNRQIMVRLSEHENEELIRAADDAGRKAADLARVLILHGLGIEEPTQRIGRTEQITIRLPVERVDQLRELARDEHRSIAQQVEHMLSAFVALTAGPRQAAKLQDAQQVTPPAPSLAEIQQIKPPPLPLATPEPQVTPRLKTTPAKRRA